MAQTGLLMFLCVLMLLVDQTRPQASRLKPKKDRRSKDREKDGDLKTQIDKLWREVNSLKEIQALQTVCLRGTKFHKKCYLAFDESKHFHEANEDCITKGGTLAIPRDSDENQALRDYGKKSVPGAAEFWLGINDMVNEGKFVDVNGVAINFFNWDRSQPNGGKRENCALFSQSSQGKWVDEACRSMKKYICEFLIP
ncbi:C-type lectin domain family 3 member A [Microcaecilia unicolor]|uniref:C-type lectin domain family 3 member A n=1 Tax=Microcaecilia unicolor TaxID=1415580 RepID=A0A6P7XSV5_9AMPH|nr:C-type lectin domain family 3 member A [Microcaecilia unicolor]